MDFGGSGLLGFCLATALVTRAAAVLAICAAFTFCAFGAALVIALVTRAAAVLAICAAFAFCAFGAAAAFGAALAALGSAT